MFGTNLARGFAVYLARGAALILLLLGADARAADIAPDAGRFVITLRDHLQAIADAPPAGDPAGDRNERLQRFRRLFLDAFDVEAIGRFSLGRFLTGTTPTEQHEFNDLFEGDLVAAYAWRFIRFTGRPLHVLGSRALGDDHAIVTTAFVNASGAEADPIDWRVLKREGRLRIVDLTMRGVSLGRLQQADYQSFLERNGGRVESLLAVLRHRVRGDAAASPQSSAADPR